MAMASEAPTVRLDTTGADHHGEAARLRELGPVVRLILPGEVVAWAVTGHELLAELVADPRISKDWRNWTAVQRGDIPDDWPLAGMLKVTNMFTADGAEHQRLRRLVTKTFTPRRVEDLRPRITAIAEELLDDLPTHIDSDGSVDLRHHYAYPLPVTVICELVGMPDQWRPQLHRLADSLLGAADPDEVLQTQRERHELLGRLVELRRQQPGEDLTSALIAAREHDPETLTDEELADTLWILLTAGHETTLNLITNAVRALLTHPDQLAHVLAGDEGAWVDVVEETLRWDTPFTNIMARHPLEDIDIAGVTIPAGEAILASYHAAGHDTTHHGGDADRFDIARQQNKHLSFGSGPHFCLGAHLARAEATIALSALFARYPDLTLAVDPTTLTPVASPFSNSASTLPVVLAARQDLPAL